MEITALFDTDKGQTSVSSTNQEIALSRSQQGHNSWTLTPFIWIEYLKDMHNMPSDLMNIAVDSHNII